MTGLPWPAEIALALLLGAVFGSFATAASWRLPRRMPVSSGRSACPACGHALGWRDLVPLLSWLAAGGRCRHCGATISRRYPVIEAATALLFVLVWARAETPGQAAVLAATALGLVVLTITDLEAGIIPDKVLAWLGPLAMAWRWLTDHGLWDMLLGGVAALAVALAVMYGFRLLFRRDALGLGDVKFLPVAGLYLGVEALAPFLVLSGVLGVALGLGWRWAGHGPRFPFGPALAAALMALLLWPDIFTFV